MAATTRTSTSQNSSNLLQLGCGLSAPKTKTKIRARDFADMILVAEKSHQTTICGKWEFTKINAGEGTQNCPFAECRQNLLRESFQIKNPKTGEILLVDKRVLHVFEKRHRFPKEIEMSHGVRFLKVGYDEFRSNVSDFLRK